MQVRERAAAALPKCVIRSWFLKPLKGAKRASNGLKNEEKVLQDLPRFWKRWGEGKITSTKSVGLIARNFDPLDKEGWIAGSADAIARVADVARETVGVEMKRA